MNYIHVNFFVDHGDASFIMIPTTTYKFTLVKDHDNLTKKVILYAIKCF